MRFEKIRSGRGMGGGRFIEKGRTYLHLYFFEVEKLEYCLRRYLVLDSMSNSAGTAILLTVAFLN